MTTMKLTEIKVEGRYRKDMGDIDGLAESMATTGLLQPVVIRPDSVLIAGERRLQAATKLGWDEIDVTVIEGFEQAAEMLKAERDENTCRKPMTPSEIVSLAKAIEAIEAPKADERVREGQERGRAVRYGKLDSADVGTHQPQQKTREIVADAVGMGRTNLGYAKKIVERAETGDPHAIEARQMMDDTGKVMPAYEHMIGQRVSHTERTQLPKAPPKFGRRRKHHQVIEAVITAMQGVAMVAEDIKELDESITSDEAARFGTDLAAAWAGIRKLTPLLKERSKVNEHSVESQDSVTG